MLQDSYFHCVKKESCLSAIEQRSAAAFLSQQLRFVASFDTYAGRVLAQMLTFISGNEVMVPGQTRATYSYMTISRVLRKLARELCIVAIVTTTIVLFPSSTKSDYENRPQYSKKELRRAITFYAKHYRLDPALLRAVIKTESDFRQHVVSHKGAVGLMQLTPDTAATLRIADVYDPIQNIRGGAKQLRRLLNLYRGDLRLTLAAYNAGIQRVKGQKVPRIRETRRYVRKVLHFYHAFKAPAHSPRSSRPSLQRPSTRVYDR